nr:DUF58 domain-containing protein [Bacillus pinisoli]
MENLLSKVHGNNPSLYSFFQEPILISGVRDYTPDDAFQQIHWKASARTGLLQTKILEKTFQQKWTFLVNVGEEGQGTTYSHYFSEQLEDRISHIAFLLQLAEKQGIEFEMYINIVARNPHRLVYLEEGSGKEHLIKGLDLLARIDHLSPLVKVNRLIGSAESSLRRSTGVILCGISKEEVLQTLSDRYILQLPMFELHSTEAGGAVQRC